MKTNKQRTLQQQKGLTIVSLLIGLLISMLCILASLTLYKNLIHVAADTKVDALHDGQLAASLLTAQKEVMTAGFGISDADASDIVKVTVPATELTPGTVSLLWRYDESGTTKCRGLVEENITRNSLNYRTLKIVEPVSGCNEVVDLSVLVWSSEVAILGQWPVIGALATYIDSNDTLIDFEITEQDCSPFGTVDLERHLSVKISAPSSAELNGATSIAENAYEYCLPNTYPAS